MEEWSAASPRVAHLLGGLVGEGDGQMESGATPFSRMSQAMRLVMTRVLPSRPARMSSGPSVASTAARCSGFNLAMSCCKGKSVGRFLCLVYPQGGWAGMVGVMRAEWFLFGLAALLSCFRTERKGGSRVRVEERTICTFCTFVQFVQNVQIDYIGSCRPFPQPTPSRTSPPFSTGSARAGADSTPPARCACWCRRGIRENPRMRAQELLRLTEETAVTRRPRA